eukprot:TRINITY_DN11755_c0_g2_i6.p3 TRINITY_DN11755_c0_g2~~TRINITY_DN11755_c0_g2_i6.p3  ORF type:complete len:214 (-),score=-29.72 TRINITY_DN11755_c0_g2_i6:183-824(-)
MVLFVNNNCIASRAVCQKYYQGNQKIKCHNFYNSHNTQQIFIYNIYNQKTVFLLFILNICRILLDKIFYIVYNFIIQLLLQITLIPPTQEHGKLQSIQFPKKQTGQFLGANYQQQLFKMQILKKVPFNSTKKWRWGFQLQNVCIQHIYNVVLYSQQQTQYLFNSISLFKQAFTLYSLLTIQKLILMIYQGPLLQMFLQQVPTYQLHIYQYLYQ